jgi:hypothetical protein
MGDGTYQIPAYPQYIDSSELDGTQLIEQGGATGIFFSGAFMFSPYGGTEYGALASDLSNDYSNCATYAEGYSFDYCTGHASSSTEASYHHHSPPSCLLNQLGADSDSQSPQIGWAFDGFPIYGPIGPDGIQIKRCIEDTADNDYCTDLCGGRYDDSQDDYDDGFVYRYHVQGVFTGDSDICTNDLWRTQDEGEFTDCGYDFPEAYYPHTPLCLRGCVPDGVTTAFPSWVGLSLSSCSAQSSYVDGYTDDYTPSAKHSSGLSSPYDIASDCSCDSDYPGECVHDSETGEYNSAPGVMGSLGMLVVALFVFMV